MLYPGSVGLLQKAMRPMLQQGQAKLIEEVGPPPPHTHTHIKGSPCVCFLQCEGQRNKLLACDGNEIDTMFVDRRRVGGQNGQTLVNGCIPPLLIVVCPFSFHQ